MQRLGALPVIWDVNKTEEVIRLLYDISHKWRFASFMPSYFDIDMLEEFTDFGDGYVAFITSLWAAFYVNVRRGEGISPNYSGQS